MISFAQKRQLSPVPLCMTHISMIIWLQVYMDKGQERGGRNGDKREEWKEWDMHIITYMGYTYMYHYILTDEGTSLNQSLVSLKSLPLELIYNVDPSS